MDARSKHLVGDPFPASMAWVLDNPLAKMHARRIVRELKVRREMRILDVGAGTGRLAIPLAEKVGPEGEVVATDLQPEMLRRLERRAVRRRVKNIRTIVGRAGETELPERHFDVAVMSSILGEIAGSERVQAMREIHRTLKPGGVLVVVEQHPDPHIQKPEAVRAYGKEAGFEAGAFRRVWLGHVTQLLKPR
jgi:ubiquinone/menaquinone biosynthesis C-methylase UbiE